jgi:CheY-like chemotaxis protein
LAAIGTASNNSAPIANIRPALVNTDNVSSRIHQQVALINLHSCVPAVKDAKLNVRYFGLDIGQIESIAMILVVEDDDRLRRLIEELLLHRGYHVISAQDGCEALDRLQREPRLSLIVTDIRMPGINGWELARRATEIRPNVKVIYITGYAGEQFPQDAPQGPLLRKPWQVSEFYGSIEKLMNSNGTHRSDP